MIVVSKPWAHSSRGRVIFASPCCRKGQVHLQIIAPRSPRRGGGEEGPGEEYVVNFAHRIVRKEGPKSRKMGFPWSSQLCSNSAQCACAHNSLSDVVPRLWNPIIIVVVIRDPLTIGDTPMCSTGIID
jgi:hypothetical protein